MSNNTTHFDYEAFISDIEFNMDYQNHIRVLFIIIYAVICVLGLVLNFWVLVTTCHVYHTRGKSSAAVWIFSLAITHLSCVAFLPFQFLYAWFHFNWRYKDVTCKFSSYSFYFSFFSTAAMLTLWSVRSCMMSLKCLKSMAGRPGPDIVMVLISVTLSTVLASPSLFSRELRYTVHGLQCIDDFDFDDVHSTSDGEQKLLIVLLSRLLLGIALPAFLMGLSCCLRRREDLRSYGRRGLAQITCWIKVAHFICWTPLIFMAMLQYVQGKNSFFLYGLPAATVLASAHCCINPVIYLLVRFELTMTWLTPPLPPKEEYVQELNTPEARESGKLL